jgi:hypothetical protein
MVEITLSTAQVPARDRNEYWHQVVCRTFVELEVTHQTVAGYRGSVRVRDYGQLKAARKPDELFTTWRHHGFVTDPTIADKVAADQTHRQHAIIENVHADLKNSALAHLPSGTFTAKCRLAGPGRHRVQPDPGR